MGLFSSIFSMFRSSSTNQSPGMDESSSYSPSEDFGVNPSTGLPMISSSLDVGGNLLCEQPTTFDSPSDSSSSFDDLSSCTSSFDDSSSCASPFDREIGSSSDFGSSSFDSFGSSPSMFDD